MSQRKGKGKRKNTSTNSANADITPMIDDKGDNKSGSRGDEGEGEVNQEIDYVRYIKTIKRFEVDSSGDIDYEEALEYFRRYQILHIRTYINGNSDSNIEKIKSFGPAQLQEMLEKFPSELKANYNVENLVGQEDLTIDQVFAKRRDKRQKGSWYASSILQASEKGTQAAKDIDSFVESRLPISKPRLFDHVDAKQSAPVWLFIGQHIPNDVTSGRQGEQAYTQELQGRKEHTDSISSSGTWHYQCCGMYRISIIFIIFSKSLYEYNAISTFFKGKRFGK